MTSNFDREKYLGIAKDQGINKAVTVLHQDLWEVEYQCFESDQGFDSQLWKVLNEMRLFSKELWDLRLTTPSSR